MEHKPFVDLQAIADLKQEYRGLTRLDRLTRWAELLESQTDRELAPLREIEWREPPERRAVRAENSPLTVAYEDPVLRAEGLASDRLGDVMDFFEITERDAHKRSAPVTYRGRSMRAMRQAAYEPSSGRIRRSEVGYGRGSPDCSGGRCERDI